MRMLAIVVAALPNLLASAAWAESEPIPAAPYQPTAGPTLEQVRAELQQMQARDQQELKELRAELTRREDEAAVEREREQAERDRLLRSYGFADVGMMRNIAPEDPSLASQFTRPLTFYLGRVNLYYDARPDPDFRFLAETRLSLYPNGTSPGVSNTGEVLRTSTSVNDVSSPNPSASVSWGSILLERAVLDWTRYALLSVRAGLFLTPFGIYNVDHGTPTLIPITLPIYISQGWIPERQLGLQLFGSQPVDRWELGYNVTVSNGRTDGVLDAGDSKAYGGRLYAKRQGELGLILGASALYQPYRRNREQFGMDGSGGITYTNSRVAERSMLTLGNDIAVDYHGLRVRNEVVFFQTEYTPGKRDAPAQARGGLAPDSRQYTWSLIVAYRYWQLEPYFRSEYFYCSPSTATMTQNWTPGIGLNVYLRPTVIVKLNWANARFYQDNDPQHQAARQNFHTFAGVLTWAF